MQKPALPALSGIIVVFVLVVLVTFTTATIARAQESASGEDERLTILITASRFAETVDEALATVTVITRREIEEKQAETVEEVLRAVPGVVFGNSGGVGKQTSLFLRGAESNHVLVLIDGVKVGNATAGTTPFEHLPIDQIEKIEVVRGPRSSLYGSEAIGGVIQIFTRKGEGEARPRFSISAGSHDTRKSDIGVSGDAKTAWYNLGASSHSTDGYSACLGSTSPFAGCFVSEDALEKDDDGYENQSVSLRGGVALTDALDIEGNFLNSDNETEFDGGFQNETETTTRLISATATLQVNARWRSSLLVGESKDETDNFKDGNYASTFDTTREQINWQNDLRISERTRLAAGVDYLNDKATGNATTHTSCLGRTTPTDDGPPEAHACVGETQERRINYDRRERDNTGVFALLRTEHNANDFELALRNDNDEQFGNHTTGSAAWGRNFNNGKRMVFSYGTAFSAPTFNDLYYPKNQATQYIDYTRRVFMSDGSPYINRSSGGNPDLKPEKSQTLDFGFSQTGRHGKLAVNFFHTKIDNLIANNANFIPVNINKATITGMEISGNARRRAWDFGVGITFQSAKDSGGGANDGKRLARRPRQVMTLDIARRFGKHRIGAGLFARGKAFDDAANARAIDGFTVLNLRFDARLHEHWRLLFKVNNATDRQHEIVDYYPQDGRNFLVTLRYIH